jgi:hypothetical protein
MLVTAHRVLLIDMFPWLSLSLFKKVSLSAMFVGLCVNMCVHKESTIKSNGRGSMQL